jgi:hypothetical protein
VSRPGQWRLLLLAAAVLVAAILVALAMAAPKTAAAGWLTGFAFWSEVPVGSLVLLMIHRLTGGRWGRSLRPVLEPAAALTPLLFLLAIPIVVAISVLYPWSAETGAKPDVLSYYLNLPFFAGRTLVALAGWSALALLLPRMRGAAGQLAAGAGLVFHGVIISLVAVDWMLSIEPPFISSSFGASVAITQIMAALAFAAVLAPEPIDDPATGDLGGLLLATVLGITYVDFMALLVIWYGNLPGKAVWFTERIRLLWLALGISAFTLGSLLPILALLLSRVRNSRNGLRFVGFSVLIGLAVYHIFIIVPPFGDVALLPAALAIVLIGLLLAALLIRPAPVFSSRSAPHG